MSALSRLAAGENRWLKIQDTDTVILSSHPIPGNETGVSKVIDGLTRLGAKVVHTGIADVHATGHAKQEELKTLISVTKPEWMIPVHGEYRHLAAHAELARQMGVIDDHVLLCEDGDRVEISDSGVRKVEPVPAGYLFVDGTVGDVGQGVLRDRKVLAEEGVVVVIVTVDIKTGAIVTGPEIVTRGWVYAPEAEELLDGAAAAVRDAIKAAFATDGTVDHENLQRHVRKAAGKYVSDQTKRRPMIVPVVMEA
jgi:ribonuclease J